MEKKPNIILITLDALRADHLSFMGYKKNTTPCIDEFSKDCLVFKKAFSAGPTTPYSFPSILTSTYPLDFGGPKKIEKPRVLISEVFKKNGFLTAAFHSSPYLSEYFGYNKGWDYFEDITFPSGKAKISKIEKFIRKAVVLVFPELFFQIVYLMYRIKKPKNRKVRASVLNQALKDFLLSAKNSEKPFFLWAHYMDTHTPPLCYSENRTCSYGELIGDCAGSAVWSYGNKGALKNFLQKKFKKYLEESIDSYDNAIKYLDSQIGEIVEFLKKENIYENSVICITSDHGDEFLEHGGIAHNIQLYNEVLFVPLLLKTLDKSRQEITKKVSLIDLSPTLCELSGIEKPKEFKGKSLLSDKNEFVFHQSAFSKKENHLDLRKLEECKMACQTENYKYIIDYATKKEELYDLKSDPKEQNDISKKDLEVLLKMQNKIKEFQKENPPLSML